MTEINEHAKRIAIAKLRELVLLNNPNFELENPGLDWSLIECHGVTEVEKPDSPPDLKCLDGTEIWYVSEKDS